MRRRRARAAAPAAALGARAAWVWRALALAVGGALAGRRMLGMAERPGRAFRKPTLATRTSAPAAQSAGPALASMLIYLLMSGLFTPIDSMAPWVQTVSLVTPVRHFVTISRAILMKGAGLADVARPLAAP